MFRRLTGRSKKPEDEKEASVEVTADAIPAADAPPVVEPVPAPMGI